MGELRSLDGEEDERMNEVEEEVEGDEEEGEKGEEVVEEK